MGFCYLFATLLISFRCYCSPVSLILCPDPLYSFVFGTMTRCCRPVGSCWPWALKGLLCEVCCIALQGFMTDFCSRMPEEEGAEELEGAPAVLLVHGFGAFGEQWRGQLSALARAGYQAGLTKGS